MPSQVGREGGSHPDRHGLIEAPRGAENLDGAAVGWPIGGNRGGGLNLSHNRLVVLKKTACAPRRSEVVYSQGG
jgi:hypothetical protein